MSTAGEKLLYVLTRMAPAIAHDQVSKHFTSGRKAGASRLCQRLARAGQLRIVEGFARRLPAPVLLAQWEPGSPLPCAGSISYASRERWLSQPVQWTCAFAATGSACNLAGVPTARLKLHQLGHDLTVCDVALAYLANRPAESALWRGEAVMAHTRCGDGEKLPDAFLVKPCGQVVRVIEVCSGYRADRVQAFIEDCCERLLAFEIWG